MTETLNDLLESRGVGRRGRLTLEEFCDKAGVGIRTLLNLRAGIAEPRRATVRALASALRVPRNRVEDAVSASRQG